MGSSYCFFVMAGLVPAIHVLFVVTLKTWTPGTSPGVTAEIAAASQDYLIACGLIGLPVPPVMISGGPQKKNS